MATRMVTQLYGDKINTPPGDDGPTDVDDPSPQLLPTVEMRAADPLNGTEPTPLPTPWVARQPSGFHALALGVMFASAVFAGLAIFSFALVWGYALSGFAYLALLVLGGYLTSVGMAYVLTAKPDTALPA